MLTTWSGRCYKTFFDISFVYKNSVRSFYHEMSLHGFAFGHNWEKKEGEEMDFFFEILAKIIKDLSGFFGKPDGEPY